MAGAASIILYDVKYFAPIAFSRLYEKRHNFLTLLANKNRSRTEHITTTRICKYISPISKDDNTEITTPTPTAIKKRQGHHKPTAKDSQTIPPCFSAYFEK
jgi:hypothetical protein